MYLTLSQIKKHLNIEDSFTEDDQYLLQLGEVAEQSIAVNLDRKLWTLEDSEGNLPSAVLQAMLYMVAQMYANREAVTYTTAQPLPLAYNYLVALYKNYNGRTNEEMWEKLHDDIVAESDRAKEAESGLQESIASISATVDTYDESIAALSADVATYDEAIASISATVETKADADSVYTKDDIDGKILTLETIITSNSTAIEDEIARAKEAESANTTAISTEVARATEAEQDLQGQIDSLTTSTSGAIEQALSDAKAYTDAETERAKEVEETLQSSIDNLDTTKANKSDVEALETSLNDEVTRATESEADLQGKIETLSGAISDNSTAINDETTRAKEAEESNSTAIANETTRAKEVEATLQTSIDTLSTSKADKADVDTLTSNLNAEITRATQAEQANATAIQNLSGTVTTDIQAAIDKEVERATSADTVLQEAIDDEAARALSAETDLQEAISNKVVIINDEGTTQAVNIILAINEDEDPTDVYNVYSQTEVDKKIEMVNSSISTETNRAISAETALQTSIDSKASKADVETLTTNLNDEITRAKTAEETNATNIASNATAISTEVTRAKEAEATLQASIDTKADADSVYTKEEIEAKGYLTEHQSLADYAKTADVETALAAKQDTLVSGTSIKTINGESVLGEGDIVVSADTSNLITKEEADAAYMPVSPTFTMYHNYGEISIPNVGNVLGFYIYSYLNESTATTRVNLNADDFKTVYYSNPTTNVLNLSDSVKEKLAKIDTLETSVSGNTESITALETSVSSLETSVSGNAESITANTAAITALQEKESTLETSVSGNTESISTLQSTISDLQTKIAELESKLNSLTVDGGSY